MKKKNQSTTARNGKSQTRAISGITVKGFNNALRFSMMFPRRRNTCALLVFFFKKERNEVDWKQSIRVRFVPVHVQISNW